MISKIDVKIVHYVTVIIKQLYEKSRLSDFEIISVWLIKHNIGK